MRIAVPIRFKPSHVAILIACVFIGQELESTNFLFSVLTAVYIALWALAYNLSGGLEYPSGAFILSNGLFSVVVGFGAKVLLLQPGDRNLREPVNTVLVYTVGMLMTVIAVFISRALRPERSLINGFDNLQQLRRASITCLIAGVVLTAVLARTDSEGGTLLSALSQLNSFPIMAILLATTYEVKHSNGQRSTNWIVITGIAISVARGLIGFSKEGMLMGFLAWGIAASLNQFSFRKTQIIGIAAGMTFMIYYLVPYSQYVRNFSVQSGTAIDNLPIAIYYLEHLDETRTRYYEALADIGDTEEPHLYDEREGFLDRLIQVAADDALIAYTDNGNVYGLAPTYAAYVNIVPRFLWPNKPSVNIGNVYGRELKIVSDQDTTTGISFSAAADAYHQLSWLGILLVLPIDLFILFLVMDSMVGSAKYSPFALLPIITLFQQGAAGGLDVTIHLSTYGVVGILLIVWTTKVAGPYVRRVVIPSSSVAFTETSSVRKVP